MPKKQVQKDTAGDMAVHPPETVTDIINTTPCHIYIFDLTTNRNIFSSPHIETMLGYTHKEFQEFEGDILETLIHPDDREALYGVVEKLKQARDNEIVEGEYRFRHKNGSWVPLHDRVSVFQRSPGGEVTQIVGSAQDITERKQLESRLFEQERILSDILESTLSGYWDWNIPNNTEYLSPSFKKMFGYEEDELPNSPEAWQKLIFEEDLPGVLKVFEQHVESHGGIPYYNEVRYRHKDGSTVWVICAGRVIEWAEDGSPVRMVGCHVDITERKQAECALEESRAQLDANARRFERWQSSNFIGIIHSNAKGDIISANDKLLSMLGYSKKDLAAGRLDWTKLTPPEFLHLDEKAMEEAALEGSWTPFEKEYFHKDGHRVPILIGGSLFQESPDEYIVFVIDLSEQRRMEERLRQSEKMNAIGQLAGGIAHDFNNQLSGVLGYADMLENRLEDENLSRYATNIKKGAKRAAELTAQLLAFSRKGKNLSVPIEIHKVLAEVNSILEHTIDKRITTRLLLNASPATTMGDPSQLQNAILNIALNARDAMPQGGELIFETELVELDEAFCTGYLYELAQGTYLKISVSDTGCGMDTETQKHIFEPFYTKKEQGKGTGMGLASVYGTVRNHNGAISVDSDVGRGTTFCIHLPLAEDTREEERHNAASAPIRGTARILLVDDEEAVRDIATDMLMELGYKVTICKDGRQAVETYKASWEEIDLVLLDMVMPELGGRDAFAAMKRINPDIRAILSSGYSINGEAQQILDEGVLAFVGKPFELAELSEKVAQVLRGGVDDSREDSVAAHPNSSSRIAKSDAKQRFRRKGQRLEGVLNCQDMNRWAQTPEVRAECRRRAGNVSFDYMSGHIFDVDIPNKASSATAGIEIAKPPDKRTGFALTDCVGNNAREPSSHGSY